MDAAATPPVQILLVEDNPGDARLVREAFRDAMAENPEGPSYQITHVDRLSASLERLSQGGIDVLILDLGLPDSDGYETFAQAHAHAPDTAIVVLTRQNDHRPGLRAMREGAQDYLPKDSFEAANVERSVRYARDRKALELERRQLARADAARLENEAQRLMLQSMFDGALDGMLLADDSGRYVDVNAATSTILGRSREELLGMSSMDLAPAQNRKAAQELWEKFLVEGHQRGEFALTHADGSHRVVEYSATAGIQPGRHLSVIRDITERRAAEMELAGLHRRERSARAAAEASEVQLSALMEMMPQMVWRTRPDGYVEYFNTRWYEYTGLSIEESRGHEAWLAALHPDDRERSGARWAEAVRTVKLYEVEYRLRHYSGNYRWYLARGLPMRDAAGKVVKWFGTSTDIDDKRRAEEMLRTLAEAGSVLSAPLDAEGTLQRIADLVVPTIADWSCVYLEDGGKLRLTSIAHVDPGKRALLREVFDRYPFSLEAPHGYPRVIRTGQAELLFDVSAGVRSTMAADPGHRQMLEELGALSAMTVPLTVAGRTFGAMNFVTGESGRRYTPDDLRLAEEIGRRVALALDSARLFELTQRERRRAEEANRIKDEFLSIASHELRTPLNAILGWSRMLRTGTLPENKRERALETIERNANVQVQLVEDILDVSRIITGKLSLRVGPVDVVQVAESAVEVVRLAADAKGVRLQVVVDRDAGIVQGDSARLQQVIWNLLANAVKFTPKGGRVQLSVQRSNSHVEVLVSDSGQGIDGAFLPHVFDAFRQADASSTRIHGGLGLGLAIVKHLVELHGGTIEVHSEGKGKGASFTVRVPVAPVRTSSLSPDLDTGEPSAAVPSLRPLICPPEIEGLRVLIVDDHPDARELLKSILEQSGATVRTGASANEAFDLLRAEPPDVLVSDIGMPGEDGYSLIRRIRALTPEQGGRTPAIALTAYARIEDRTRALMEGFTNQVSKPVEPQELLAVLAAAVGRHARAPDPSS